MIEARNLTYMYRSPGVAPVTALDRLNFEIRRGQSVGIMGPTGSGKSTLIQNLNGLLRPTGGSLTVDGIRIETASKKQMSVLRSRVGIVFQFPEQQLFEATVFADVAFGPRNLGLAAAEVEKRVARALEAVGLPGEQFARRSPLALSGGQKRRVAIAGVLAMQPQLLILDEPTAGLDPGGRRRFLQMVRALRQEQPGLTILMVTHRAEELAGWVDRVLVLHEGRLLMAGSEHEVFTRTDELTAIGLQPPVSAVVFNRLRQFGWELNSEALQPEEAAKLIAGCWHKRMEEKAKCCGT